MTPREAELRAIVRQMRVLSRGTPYASERVNYLRYADRIEAALASPEPVEDDLRIRTYSDPAKLEADRAHELLVGPLPPEPVEGPRPEHDEGPLPASVPPKGIRQWAHIEHPGVRLFRRIMDKTAAGIASVFATDEEWRSLNALIDAATPPASETGLLEQAIAAIEALPSDKPKRRNGRPARDGWSTGYAAGVNTGRETAVLAVQMLRAALAATSKEPQP